MILEADVIGPELPADNAVEPAVAPGTALQMRENSNALALRVPRSHLPSGIAELFRGIYRRARVRDIAVLGVCSAISGEGKTTVSLGLAQTLAQDFPDRRVLVVEADVERPTLASRLGFDPNPGLIECVLEDQPIQVGYRTTTLENLHLLPAGGPTDFPGRVLRSGRMAAAIEAMCQTHDLVILDVPAILPNGDALLLTELTEGVIFVVRAGVTPMPGVKKAISELNEGLLRGVVLNGTTSAIPRWLRRLCGI